MVQKHIYTQVLKKNKPHYVGKNTKAPIQLFLLFGGKFKLIQCRNKNQIKSNLFIFFFFSYTERLIYGAFQCTICIIRFSFFNYVEKSLFSICQLLYALKRLQSISSFIISLPQIGQAIYYTFFQTQKEHNVLLFYTFLRLLGQ